jgi:Flp pilus assembly pilin Flp
MIAICRALAANKSGATAAEYALLLVLAFLAIITGTALLGPAIAVPITEMGTALQAR